MRNAGNKIKAIHFPYDPANPYQPNLTKALGERGVIAEGVEDFTLRTLIKASKDQDILHLHWAHPYLLNPKLSFSMLLSLLFFAFLCRQKLRGAKLIWTVHNLAEHEPRHPLYELLCYRALARLADGIIVHSHYAKNRVLEVYRLGRRSDKIRVIPHGNYIGNYPNEISREQARAKLGIGLEKKTFLFLGAIRGYKGIPALISAFTRTATGDEVLIIAGKPLNEKIKTEIFQLAAKRDDIFFFPEFVAECDIQTYLNTADAVVFPFRDIFTSGSALLAMSFSKALIVPDLESVAEIIMAGGAIPYDPHDETGLANALAAARSTDLQKLGRNNYEAAQNISWNSIAGQTLELYRGTLLGSTYIP